MQQTYDLLSHLGAASSYKGYHYLAYIIDRIVAQNNEPTPFRIKDFYVDAAQHFHTSPDSIQFTGHMEMVKTSGALPDIRAQCRFRLRTLSQCLWTIISGIRLGKGRAY